MPVTEGTIRHDLHYMELVSKMGLQSLTKRDEEAAEEYVLRLLGEMVGAGIVLELLGTLLVPEGTDPESWTPEMARETAAFLAGLQEPKHKAEVHAHVVTLLLDFFERGMVSFWSSRRSSPKESHPARRAGTTAIATGGR